MACENEEIPPPPPEWPPPEKRLRTAGKVTTLCFDRLVYGSALCVAWSLARTQGGVPALQMVRVLLPVMALRSPQAWTARPVRRCATPRLAVRLRLQDWPLTTLLSRWRGPGGSRARKDCGAHRQRQEVPPRRAAPAAAAAGRQGAAAPRRPPLHGAASWQLSCVSGQRRPQRQCVQAALHRGCASAGAVVKCGTEIFGVQGQRIGARCRLSSSGLLHAPSCGAGKAASC